MSDTTKAQKSIIHNNNHKDRARNTIRCKKCERVLAKVDVDNVVHIKPTRGPEVILSETSRLMFVCEKISYFQVKSEDDPRIASSKFEPKKLPNGKTEIWLPCGNRTIVENGEVIETGVSDDGSSRG